MVANNLFPPCRYTSYEKTSACLETSSKVPMAEGIVGVPITHFVEVSKLKPSAICISSTIILTYRSSCSIEEILNFNIFKLHMKFSIPGFNVKFSICLWRALWVGNG
ncbi:hypothetical protein AVEN_8385-1 [Araneus ventricosus]|uniref:Uncharacterized protein n=1 Tax=Araneus ventricosus TaxID=182803 RepID=A0A4Y2KF45_ARAVE|nr:hypothetical protein AVEN_8385-1 [Araneus ventricosus]